MARRQVFRLAEAVVLLLFLLLPMMLLLGAAEGTAGRPTPLFWILWVLPLLMLPWLWSRRHPEETLEPDDARHRVSGATDMLRYWTCGDPTSGATWRSPKVV
jgi:hypothetical protein